MSRVMTKEQIYAEFKDEWVLIQDPVTDESLNIIEGNVVFHGKDRGEMYSKIGELAVPRYIATLYTGKTPSGKVMVL